jgi:adenylate kinase family enzyme
VALLAFTDGLPRRPRRILVAGTSGSGKTTIAGAIAVALGIPHIEIDALYHGPNWTPRQAFESDVRSFSSQPAWVTEWQYSQVRPLLAERADLVVWLDLPRRTVMWQVIRRTLHRRLRRQLLWNGNIEPPLWTVVQDHEHIVRWAWTTHHKTETRMRELNQGRPDLPIVRLRSGREAMHWLGVTLSAITTDGAGESPTTT